MAIEIPTIEIIIIMFFWFAFKWMIPGLIIKRITNKIEDAVKPKKARAREPDFTDPHNDTTDYA